MNSRITDPEIQAFIKANLKADVARLLFKGSPFPEISIQEIVTQIEAKNKAQQKLPTWFETDGIYYANKLNIAQSSSETTAQYKASLIEGNHLLDLTGGFGVDTLAFAKQFKQTSHCEIDPALSAIAAHNFSLLTNKPINCIASDGLAYLKNSTRSFDWIFVDPSRRHDHKGKVFLLADCQPNLLEELSTLFTHSDKLMVKVSPLLDLSQTINELNHVTAIHVVAVENDVKELLFILDQTQNTPITIHCINFTKQEPMVFQAAFHSTTSATYAAPENYLYEPNAAILKAGLFNEVAAQFQLHKLHRNSHLYTAQNLIKFPGRRFKIIADIPFDKKALKKILPEQKAHISTRNFPVSVAEIRKKTKIRDGGNHYLFFTTNHENKRRVLVCEKVEMQ